MSRASESRPEYGLVGAGAVAASLPGRLPDRARLIGPVAAVSPRVASRIVNGLRAGYPVRSASDLNKARTLLITGTEAFLPDLFAILRNPEVTLSGRVILCCDCEPDAALIDACTSAGAHVASVNRCPAPDRLVVEGDPSAVPAAMRLVARLGMKPILISPEQRDLFEAALTLGTAVTSGIADRVFRMLRQCGLRDKEALRLAAAMISQTAKDYERSGRQSWTWHVRPPDVARLEAAISAAGEDFGPLLRGLVLLALRDFEKHPEETKALAASVSSCGE